MKITIDLKKLLKKGEITQEEFDKFSKFAKRQTGTDAIAFLTTIAVGAIVIGLGVLFLPSVLDTLKPVIEFFVSVFGVIPEHLLKYVICLLLFVGGVYLKNTTMVNTSVVFGFFLILPLKMIFTAPLAYIVLFAVLSFAGLLWSKHSDYEHVALGFARTCFFIANFGLFVGSLAGKLSMYYAVAWAIILVLLFIWGTFSGRRFVVTSSSAFGVVHFFIQWVKWVPVTPISLVIGGVIALVATSIVKRNHQKQHQTVEKKGLVEAASEGVIKEVTLLLKEGANPNTQDKDGNTALMEAASNNYKRMARLLLRKGADLNKENNDGETALMMALENNHEEMVLLLKRQGATK